MKKKWYSMANVKSVNIKQNDPGVSITQPDESLSIRQILARVAAGKTTGLGDLPAGEYEDEDLDDYDEPAMDPDFDKLDALAIINSDEAEELRETERQEKVRKRKKKEQEAFDAEVEKRVQARLSEQPSTAEPGQ